MFSIVAAPIHTPTNSAQELSLLHNLTNLFIVYFIITILTGLR